MKENEPVHSYMVLHARRALAGVQNVSRKNSRKNVHDLRVELRRLRTVFWAMKRDPVYRAFHKINRHFKKLGHRLGAVRELDVAVRDAESLEIKTGNLKRRRRQRRKELSAYLKRHRRQITHDAKAACAMTFEAKSLRDGLRRLIDDLNGGKPMTLKSMAEFHKLRIAIKRARYLMESFGKDSGALKSLQSHLGRLHDLEVLQDHVGRSAAIDAKIESLKTEMDREGPAGTRTAVCVLRSLARPRHRSGVASR